MRCKLFGFAFTVEAVLVMAIFTILFCAGAYFGKWTVDNYKTDHIITEYHQVQAALESYSDAHMDVDVDTLRFGMDFKDVGYTYYAKKKYYPEKLSDVLYYLSTNIDLTEFSYTRDAHDPSKYVLKVGLPNGNQYTEE